MTRLPYILITIHCHEAPLCHNNPRLFSNNPRLWWNNPRLFIQEQLQKARAEYEKIVNPEGPSSVRQPLSEQSKTVGQYYDLLGRRLESLPAHTLYIQNGKKVIR